MSTTYTMTEIAKKIIDISLGTYRFIYIGGNGGAGKSTLSKQLIQELDHRGIVSNYIDMDDVMISSEIRKNAKKIWIDKNNTTRESYYGRAFRESHHLEIIESMIYSLSQGLDYIYKSPKNKDFTRTYHTYPITIIEGVGTAFLDKNPQALSIFMMCDPEIELQRRLERNRDGESDVSREQVQQKLIERNEQFEINILPERDKFDIELWSHEDYTIEIKRQDVGL